MKKLILLAFSLFGFFGWLPAEAQNTTATSKCKCKYPYKPDPPCWDYCLRQLFHKEDFKKLVDKSRLSDSGKVQLNTWLSDSSGTLKLRSVLEKRDMGKIDNSLQGYMSDPANMGLSKSPFMHSLGITLSIWFATYTNPMFPEHSETFMMRQTNFTYFPRYLLSEGENSSLTVGIPLGLGFGIARNNDFSDAGLMFSYDLPVALDYNFGIMSVRTSESRFGGYIGAGFGYHHVSVKASTFSDFSGATYGPIARIGFRFKEKEDWYGKSCTAGFFYKRGMEKAKLNTIGVNFLYDF